LLVLCRCCCCFNYSFVV